MKIDFKKIITLIVFLLILILLIIWTAYFCLVKNYPSEKQPKKLNQEYCLVDDEYVNYKVGKNPIGGGIAEISIKDKNNNQEKFSFRIEISSSEHYHPIEIHKCGAYVVRTFGYDYEEKTPIENYKRELWVYRYNGEGKALISDSSKWSYENILGDFRVDPTETYVILERGYLGKDDYAIIIKDLKTKEDAFIFSIQEIINKHPDLVGNIRLDGWSDDGHYFWFDIHVGAMRLGFVRIDTLNWKADIFPAPENVMGGDALNFNTGYVTAHPYNKWYGIYEIEQVEKEKMRKEGIGSEIYIENLVTKKRHFVDKTDEPLWFFKPKWISDTELEYYLPFGEKKVYETVEL